MNKLHHKDFSIAFKTGTDANKSKFKKEAVQGEMYFATDSRNLYVAETTAGLSDATLSQFIGPEIFNVTTRDTEANILASTPTLSAGEAGIAFAIHTHDFYIYDGSAWYIYKNDTNFNDSLVFPTIEVFDNESDFITDTGADDYTIVHAKDTDKLYVWTGSAWLVYDNDSTV